MSSESTMKKIATIKSGVYDLDNGRVAVVKEGKLKIYATKKEIIAQKMEQMSSMTEVMQWLVSKREGQPICFMESGSYYSDTLIIQVTKGEATLYIKD